ncbi:2-C-methyl-D-erythritol 2,4-cyclodiphosphate synthase [Palleronia aestuarii]|uniref:Bifunctional enzyme IspD/IspF n=2 Tax=Palleronia aestuarii TaxID=568105 RepID=A0A2W7NHP1_9RHOB|nr:2-C-methyl-D-erythritol 2,4-cyclodiphosphate synthase [Palleronia aestuarii]
MTAAVIVAAGRGTRAGPGLPKQWRSLGGRALLAWPLDTFRAHPRIDRVVLVLHPDDMGVAAGYAAHPDVDVAEGGETRQASVRAGLEALDAGGADRVLIHDVARPLVDAALIDRVIDALDDAQGAAPALPVVDALWEGDGGKVGAIRDRTGLYRAQTPQGFHLGVILDAHRAHPGGASDDVAVAQSAGIGIEIVRGSETNFKITEPEDFARAEAILEHRMDIRTGTGFDVHAFGPGDFVTLCGIPIPHDRGLLGHSDADVALHALADAIYGALAEGDIGRHFPPSDPQWRGTASHVFLEHAAGLAAQEGLSISNVDLTLICEEPKITPHARDMIERVAHILDLSERRVSVKATTSEGLGFTGRREGIAAMASVTLVSR